MKTDIIPTKVHGFIDYATAISLIALPWLFSGKNKGLETYLPMAIGAGVILQSLATDYELGAKKALPMDKHLQLDYANGALMAASPFLFGFYKKTWMPHLMVGLSELAIALLSKSKK